MEQRVSLITLGVRDLARARAFYEGVGWEVAHNPSWTLAEDGSVSL
jgi:hypothetical protein